MSRYDEVWQRQEWRREQRVRWWRGLAAFMWWHLVQGMVVGLVGLLVWLAVSGFGVELDKIPGLLQDIFLSGR